MTLSPNDRDAVSSDWIKRSDRLPKVGGTYLVGAYDDSMNLPRTFVTFWASFFLFETGPEWHIRDAAHEHRTVEYWFNLPPHPEHPGRETASRADRDAVIEECAKVAEGHARRCRDVAEMPDALAIGVDRQGYRDFSEIGENIASSIRSLKSSPATHDDATPSEHGSSAALRAQDQSFAHELQSRANTLDGIADGLWSTNKIRADQVRFIASALQWIATQLITRHEPAGGSAAAAGKSCYGVRSSTLCGAHTYWQWTIISPDGSDLCTISASDADGPVDRHKMYASVDLIRDALNAYDPSRLQPAEAVERASREDVAEPTRDQLLAELAVCRDLATAASGHDDSAAITDPLQVAAHVALALGIPPEHRSVTECGKCGELFIRATPKCEPAAGKSREWVRPDDPSLKVGDILEVREDGMVSVQRGEGGE